MNKTEIITQLNTAHSVFWNTASHLPNPSISLNGKWSILQNVVHITISITRVNSYLALPKSSIEANFGLSGRASVSNEILVKIYLNAIANGVKATAPYIPEDNIETDIKELIDNGSKTLEELVSNLHHWSEEDLEQYLCPHPVLGKITVRELLYFTIYHVQHHTEIIKKTNLK